MRLMSASIDIARRNYLLYLLLPHSVKMRLLTPASRLKLDEINRASNVTIYSGEGAANYDQLHRYDETGQHDFPLRELIEERWLGAGYGRAIEFGAGSGYATVLIARHARSVSAVELVPDMQEMIRERCRRELIGNVDVLGGSLFDLDDRVGVAAYDTAFVIQSLHHLHRRAEVFQILYRVLRPGGRVLLLEPHHNIRRALRLFRNWRREYRAKSFWSNELNWATHDFVTCGEIRSLARHAGFSETRISGYWLPRYRQLFPERRKRLILETITGHLPGIRHLAAVLAIEARRPEAKGSVNGRWKLFDRYRGPLFKS